MKEAFEDLGLLVVPWILIIFIAAIFMRGLDWFFGATHMKNIKHKKEMLAWMAGAAALFFMGGWGLWKSETSIGGAVVWFGFGGLVSWMGVDHWKKWQKLEKSWEQTISNPNYLQEIRRHPENYQDDFKEWINENHPNLLSESKTRSPEPSKSQLNIKTKQIIKWAAILFVASCLFPPWQYTADRNGNGGFHRRKPAGYSLIFLPPAPENEGVSYGVKMDSNRLIIEWAALAVVTGLVWMLFVKSSEHPDEKAGSPRKFIPPPGNPRN